MLTTVETIQISETTTSCRVHIGDVNCNETLDERYRRHFEAEADAQQPTPARADEQQAPAGQEVRQE
ncbi:MAG TPA: hypothetical protein VJ866_07890 [Pyrinomonadaceae bacterium]|nr:hypothetical protein [Pyrinomonadaceae bacterium]